MWGEDIQALFILLWGLGALRAHSYKYRVAGVSENNQSNVEKHILIIFNLFFSLLLELTNISLLVSPLHFR